MWYLNVNLWHAGNTTKVKQNAFVMEQYETICSLDKQLNSNDSEDNEKVKTCFYCFIFIVCTLRPVSGISAEDLFASCFVLFHYISGVCVCVCMCVCVCVFSPLFFFKTIWVFWSFFRMQAVNFISDFYLSMTSFEGWIFHKCSIGSKLIFTRDFYCHSFLFIVKQYLHYCLMQSFFA